MYDSEDNHILVRDMLDAFSVIPARYVQYMYQYEVQVGDTEKKQMKHGYYSKLLYGSTK
jgi:hypothetical protein